MNIKFFKMVLSLHLVISLLISCKALTDVVLAEGCLHTNIDRSTIEMYEQIIDNDKAHELTCWMTTMCFACGEIISDVELFSQEEPHQFVEDGSVLTCKWCEYQTTKEAVEATAMPTAQPTATPTPTPSPTATPKPTATSATTLLDTEYISGDYKYKLYSNGDAVIASYAGKDAVLDIPSYLEGHTVVSIGKRAFRYNESIISITIPDSVISIEESAFYSCDNLSNVVIPASVTDIASGAFRGSNSLSSITVAKSSVSYYVKNGLLIDKRIQEVIGVAPASIGTDLIIPEGILSLGESALASCDFLENVVCPDGLIRIGDGAIAWCDSLLNVTIPSSVTSIGEDAFVIAYKNDIDPLYYDLLVTCPRNSYAWQYAEKNNIPVSDGITAPDNTLLNEAYSSGDYKYRLYRNGGAVICYYSGNNSMVTIPNTLAGHEVVEIGESSFYFSYMESITIPDGVTSIGDSAFEDCIMLKSIVIPDSVINIGSDAFKGCNKLTIFCSRGSYAWQYARQNGIEVKQAK